MTGWLGSSQYLANWLTRSQVQERAVAVWMVMVANAALTNATCSTHKPQDHPNLMHEKRRFTSLPSKASLRGAMCEAPLITSVTACLPLPALS